MPTTDLAKNNNYSIKKHGPKIHTNRVTDLFGDERTNNSH